jgi:hypothetical protein
MTDPKKNPTKFRKPFFRRKTEPTLPDPTKLMPATDSMQHPERPWYRPTLLKTAAIGLGLLVIIPNRAHGQFGLDTAAILAALSKMQSLMSTYMATPLKTINQYEQTTAKYEQEVMYPIASINQAKSSVSQFEASSAKSATCFMSAFRVPPCLNRKGSSLFCSHATPDLFPRSLHSSSRCTGW